MYFVQTQKIFITVRKILVAAGLRNLVTLYACIIMLLQKTARRRGDRKIVFNFLRHSFAFDSMYNKRQQSLFVTDKFAENELFAKQASYN